MATASSPSQGKKRITKKYTSSADVFDLFDVPDDLRDNIHDVITQKQTDAAALKQVVMFSRTEIDKLPGELVSFSFSIALSPTMYAVLLCRTCLALTFIL